MKPIEELEFTDDYMFGAVLQDSEICKTDHFKKNLQCYTFENICLEDKTISLNDNVQKLIYNANGYVNEKDENLKSFMQFVATGKPTDDFTSAIKQSVDNIKHTEIFRTEYLKMYIGMEDEKRRAVKEAVTKAVKEAVDENTKKVTESVTKNFVISMLNNNIPLETISNCTSLSVEEVEQIKSEING